MPNRMLRDWTQSETVNSVSDKSEIFFIRLIMKADDYGCFYGNLKLLKSALFPLKNITEIEIKKCIEECVKTGLIIFYKVESKEYVKIINFGQRLRTMYRKFPEPEAVIENDSNLPSFDSKMPLEVEVEREVEREEKKNKIPPFEEFLKYALENKSDVNQELVKLKYKAWEVAGWKAKDKPIKNWKSTLLNTLPYLTKVNTEQEPIKNTRKQFT